MLSGNFVSKMFVKLPILFKNRHFCLINIFVILVWRLSVHTRTILFCETCPSEIKSWSRKLYLNPYQKCNSWFWLLQPKLRKNVFIHWKFHMFSHYLFLTPTMDLEQIITAFLFGLTLTQSANICSSLPILHYTFPCT